MFISKNARNDYRREERVWQQSTRKMFLSGSYLNLTLQIPDILPVFSWTCPITIQLWLQLLKWLDTLQGIGKKNQLAIVHKPGFGMTKIILINPLNLMLWCLRYKKGASFGGISTCPLIVFLTTTTKKHFDLSKTLFNPQDPLQKMLP